MSQPPTTPANRKAQQAALLHYIWQCIDFWHAETRRPDVRDKLAGLAHSILVALDRGSVTLPPYELCPMHDQDGEAWLPGTDNIAGALHEQFSRYAPPSARPASTASAAAPSPTPGFGERVVIQAVYRRRGGYAPAPDGSGGRWRKWWEAQPLPAPRVGLYIGARTLTDGWNTYFGEDSELEFIPEHHFRAALVVCSERERPVLVPLNQICLSRGEIGHA